jgi:6-phosphogluconolactonase (cycloisomerase 2 family)
VNARNSTLRHTRVALLVAITCCATLARADVPSFLDLLQEFRDDDFGLDALEQADAVAVSPDGAHVYVGGARRGTVAALAYDAIAQQFTLLDAQRDGENGVDGTGGARGVAVSPDGAHVYVAGAGDDAVAAFARSPATGILTFVEAEFDDAGGVDGLAGAHAVAVSPDGAHVYATGYDDGAVAVFSRDSLTGALTFVESEAAGDRATGVVVTSDGAHVYVGHAQFGSRAVLAIFARDPETGALSLVSDSASPVEGLSVEFNVAQRVMALAVTPDGSSLYTAIEEAGYDYYTGALVNTHGHVSALARDPATGAASLVDREREYGNILKGVSSLGVGADGTHVYVTVAPGNYLDGGRLADFARDPTTGALEPLDEQRDRLYGVRGLDGAAAVATSPTEDVVYVASPDDSAVVAFARDSTSGALGFTAIQDEEGVNGIVAATDAVVSPDDRYVYVAGGGESINVFARNPANGELAFVRAEEGIDAGAGSYISPDGKQFYAMGGSTGTVLDIYDRNPASGALDFLQRIVKVHNNPTALVVSPNGVFLYFSDNVCETFQCFWELKVFERDFASGLMTERYAYRESDGVPAQSYALAASPNGAFLYAGGYERLSAFARNPDTGELALVEAYPDVDLVRSLAASADGRHLYALRDDSLGGAITILARANDGRLSFAGNLEGLAPQAPNVASEATTLSVNPNGDAVYVVTRRENLQSCVFCTPVDPAPDGLLRVYARDRETGLLTFAGDAQEARPRGRTQGTPVATNDDGRSVYVASYYTNALVTFAAPEPDSAALAAAAISAFAALRRGSRWRPRQDSNLRPLAPEASALSN